MEVQFLYGSDPKRPLHPNQSGSELAFGDHCTRIPLTARSLRFT